MLDRARCSKAVCALGHFQSDSFVLDGLRVDPDALWSAAMAQYSLQRLSLQHVSGVRPMFIQQLCSALPSVVFLEIHGLQGCDLEQLNELKMSEACADVEFDSDFCSHCLELRRFVTKCSSCGSLICDFCELSAGDPIHRHPLSNHPPDALAEARAHCSQCRRLVCPSCLPARHCAYCDRTYCVLCFPSARACPATDPTDTSLPAGDHQLCCFCGDVTVSSVARPQRLVDYCAKTGQPGHTHMLCVPCCMNGVVSDDDSLDDGSDADAHLSDDDGLQMLLSLSVGSVGRDL